MAGAPKVYLAGPEVFLVDGRAVGDEKQAICARHGLTGLFPLDNKVMIADPREKAAAIFQGDVAMMREADAIIANLTGFRGPSADAGTVFELGFMAALGKPLFAYTTTSGTYAERVARFTTVRRDGDGRLIDADGICVEDFLGEDNLMITEALAVFGARMMVFDRGPKGDLADMAAFEACVKVAARYLLP